ncbi:unnamed protein product [Fraxinus pennsylvanica]|uniref:ENTH domain-containing protein n=1 Tax=Fraxinus pennsylvanica TaxID=56036 RepID=A0AAD2DID5_9LAMI|nr:unnamed protein product [Fraxinus pennsylvanica]
MGRIVIRDLIGFIKDKASLFKAALVPKPSTLSLRLAVLRVTTHSPPAPPNDGQLSNLLLLGDSSRATASAIIATLMDRLHRTRNCIVALKCLMTIHHIIKHGPFILQDQISIFPVSGGFNYLKLSAFRDGSTATTWALSAWVRWYARYLETLLSSSRVLGYFLCSSSCSTVKENQEQRIPSFLDADLIRDVDSLVGLVEEMCEVPDFLLLERNMLLNEIMILLSNDYLSAVNEILVRIGELRERLSCLSFCDLTRLVRALKRLQDCKEKLLALFTPRKTSIETLWGLIEELYELLDFGRGKASELARLEQRVVNSGDSVQFRSGRFSFLVQTN